MKLLVSILLLITTFPAMAIDAVFLVPVDKISSSPQMARECKIIYGAPGNFISKLGHVVHPPFADMIKALDIDEETTQLVRESLSYNNSVSTADVKSKLMAWQNDCDENSGKDYRNSFVCSTESLTGGFGGPCADMRRLVMKMNEHIYKYPNYDWVINSK